ncbi:hypothetical protein BWD09_11510 [Neisseria dentiae]|uniref:Uncharacterized protein n=1 Tax=Neisseria dentiae TaxID=194197 RepID=A0A1X3D2D5_9NEIS|nr:hypothetical protein [Neisseria dentiae]OSI14083.1 hypothetical protein BWD09_11510 [Neisseria dentiae]QMT45369.1 hypothetical protein H3L92_00465 [Neisseria dentiae]
MLADIQPGLSANAPQAGFFAMTAVCISCYRLFVSFGKLLIQDNHHFAYRFFQTAFALKAV